DQLADLLPEGVWLYEQIRLEDDEKISIVLLRAEPRARQQPERLHDQSETKSLISAKGQQCAAPRLGGVACRMSVGIDGNPFRQLLSETLAVCQIGPHKGRGPH